MRGIATKFDTGEMGLSECTISFIKTSDFSQWSTVEPMNIYNALYVLIKTTPINIWSLA